ncbi:MAG TPA: nuclear transport factor 2 family protein [Acidimicrobiales bacterium]|jgi:ketosteroid isomerase-like protein
MIENRRAEISDLSDRQAITDVLHRYCRAIDRADEELLASVYHPDAFDDHGSFSGDATAFVSRTIERMRDEYEASQHRIANVLIDLQGDLAYVESYVSVTHCLTDNRIEFAGARYVDRFSRRDGVWKIAHRLAVVDWQMMADRGETSQHISAFAQGSRDRTDPVYRRD